MSTVQGQATSIALVPCNGLSARGQVTRRVANLIREQLQDITVLDLVPLMAEIPEAVARLQQAQHVISLAGCKHRCEESCCQKLLSDGPALAIEVDDLLPQDARALDEIDEPDLDACVQRVASHLLGKISSL